MDYNKKNYNYENSIENNIPFNYTNRIQKRNLNDIQKNEKNLNYSFDNDFKGRKYSYNNARYKYNKLSNCNIGKNQKYKIGELNYLENYLSTLLKERAQLENNLLEISDPPRTLKDIKLKNSIKDRITQSDKEIFNIQQQLKEIRGY